MQNPKISVIIPSYNSIKYIEESLQSVQKQSLKDIEILCIDANSNDGTLEFLQKEAQKDERIRLIISPKKSLGYQLNLGFKEAKGEYVSIVESDDYARLDMCEKLYELALKTKCDVIKADIIQFKRKKKQINFYANICRQKSLYEKILEQKDKNALIKHSYSMNQSAIYKLDFIRKFKIRANESEGASYQDCGLWHLFIFLAPSIYLHPEAFYFYRQDNENSSMKSKEKVYSICDEFAFTSSFLDDYKDIKDKLYPAFLFKRNRTYWWNFKRIDDRFKEDFLKAFARDFKDELDKLDPYFFSKGAIKDLKKIVDDPVKFYKEYKSLTFKIRKFTARLRRKLKAFLNFS